MKPTRSHIVDKILSKENKTELKPDNSTDDRLNATSKLTKSQHVINIKIEVYMHYDILKALSMSLLYSHSTISITSCIRFGVCDSKKVTFAAIEARVTRLRIFSFPLGTNQKAYTRLLFSWCA